MSIDPVSLNPERSAVRAGIRTVAIEREALGLLECKLAEPELGNAFDAAARAIATAAGRVVVTGMGKSGLVGRKIAATFASTGTPAFFIHPAEAGHGDLGMITGEDIVLALSWSGETGELSDIVSYCQRFAVPLIALTAHPESSLASRANIVLTLPLVREACPNHLAPTSSTIIQSAIGDALALALVEKHGFSADDFRIFHPKGRLGAQLMRVGDIMATGDQLPQVEGNATILSAMLEMSRKRFGSTAIVDGSGMLIGAFTDGDLRRSLISTTIDARVSDHMTYRPLTIAADQLASEALAIMNDNNVTQLFVLDDAALVGMIHVHDVLRAGIV